MTERSALDRTWQELDEARRGPAPAQLSQYLRQVRELKVRDSEGVVRWGSLLLERHASSLAYEELWLVKEQVAIAAMDGPNQALAFKLVEEIRAHFPNSRRADRLTGMFNEARGRMDEAQAWYEKTMKDCPADQGALKRQVAQVAARGETAMAATLLGKYLGLYANDVEAWEELAALYLQASQYQQAAFCFEEALLHEPGRLGLHLRYADTLYTIGGLANFKEARQYYASALQLSDGRNPRALYGAAAATASLLAIGGAKGGKADEDCLGAAAAETLLRRYSEQAEEKLPFVRELLQAQGFVAGRQPLPPPKR